MTRTYTGQSYEGPRMHSRVSQSARCKNDENLTSNLSRVKAVLLQDIVGHGLCCCSLRVKIYLSHGICSPWSELLINHVELVMMHKASRAWVVCKGCAARTSSTSFFTIKCLDWDAWVKHSANMISTLESHPRTCWLFHGVKYYIHNFMVDISPKICIFQRTGGVAVRWISRVINLVCYTLDYSSR
jgi:hypothetical protein